jgi:small conductance mechanosensitive channel
MELGDDGVNLSARCWVENTKYLRVLSDVTEKVKLRFDEEKIRMAHPQRDIHLIREPDPVRDH